MEFFSAMIFTVIDTIMFFVGVFLTYHFFNKFFQLMDWVLEKTGQSSEAEERSARDREHYTRQRKNRVSYASDDEDALVHSLRRSLRISKQITRNYREQGISLKKENHSLKRIVKNDSSREKENKSLREEIQHVKRILSFQKDLLKQRDLEIEILEGKTVEEKTKESPNFWKRTYDLLLNGLSHEVHLPEGAYY